MYPLIISVLLFLLSPLLPFRGAQAYAAVVINEVFPKTSDPAQSWIELYNSGSEAVSLDRWSLANTVAPSKTYTMNASFFIQPHAYMVVSQTQSGITFSVSGDSVVLKDDKGANADNQSYGGTLGYNVAMGRSEDGAGVWSICTIQTPGKTNTCPAPTATPSPVPTDPPVATPTPIAPTSMVTVVEPTRVLQNDAPVMPIIPGLAYRPTPTPTLQPDVITLEIPRIISIPKVLAIQIAVVIFAWVLLATIAKKSQKKQKPRL